MKYILVLLAFSNFAMAKVDTNLPEFISLENAQYSLCKEHTIRYAYVIKIAYVGLYLKDCSSQVDVMAETDKLIRFHYQVDVKAEVFRNAAEEFFIKNLTDTPVNKNIQELKRFNQFYENINESDYYDLYLQQGHSLKLYKNTKLLGFSENSDFANKYYTIWFGDDPAVKSLKKAFMS